MNALLYRFLAWITPAPSPLQQAARTRAMDDTLKRRAHVEELGERVQQVTDWWNSDATANHYAQRLAEALRAEDTGNQNKIKDEDTDA